MSDTEYSIVNRTQNREEVTKRITKCERKCNPTKPITSELPPHDDNVPVEKRDFNLTREEILFISRIAEEHGISYDEAVCDVIHKGISIMMKLEEK